MLHLRKNQSTKSIDWFLQKNNMACYGLKLPGLKTSIHLTWVNITTQENIYLWSKYRSGTEHYPTEKDLCPTENLKIYKNIRLFYQKNSKQT